jgi:hypothetical protein
MSKKVLITQSNYIPWKGYFDTINMVDEFIIYDDMQFTRRDWRNRNKIKTPQGAQWLTIRLRLKGNISRKSAIQKSAIPAGHLITGKPFLITIQRQLAFHHIRALSKTYIQPVITSTLAK